MLVYSGTGVHHWMLREDLITSKGVVTKAVRDSTIEAYRQYTGITGIKPLSLLISIVLRTIVKKDTTLKTKESTNANEVIKSLL